MQTADIIACGSERQKSRRAWPYICNACHVYITLVNSTGETSFLYDKVTLINMFHFFYSNPSLYFASKDIHGFICSAAQTDESYCKMRQRQMFCLSALKSDSRLLWCIRLFWDINLEKIKHTFAQDEGSKLATGHGAVVHFLPVLGGFIQVLWFPPTVQRHAVS